MKKDIILYVASLIISIVSLVVSLSIRVILKDEKMKTIIGNLQGSDYDSLGCTFEDSNRTPIINENTNVHKGDSSMIFSSNGVLKICKIDTSYITYESGGCICLARHYDTITVGYYGNVILKRNNEKFKIDTFSVGFDHLGNMCYHTRLIN